MYNVNVSNVWTFNIAEHMCTRIASQILNIEGKEGQFGHIWLLRGMCPLGYGPDQMINSLIINHPLLVGMGHFIWVSMGWNMGLLNMGCNIWMITLSHSCLSKLGFISSEMIDMWWLYRLKMSRDFFYNYWGSHSVVLWVLWIPWEPKE